MDNSGNNNPKLSKIYAEEYLKRAKLDNDKIKISRGYFYFTLYYSELDRKKAICFTDSIIEVCKNCRHEKYPALGYYFKGYLVYQDRKYKEALDIFFDALEHVKKNKNIRLELDIRNAIISSKANWSSNQETLKYKIETLNFIKSQSNYKIEFKEDYLLVLDDLSKDFIKNEKYFQALDIIQEGILQASNDKKWYYDFVSIAGAAQYFLGNYQASIDSLEKTYPYENNDGKLMNNYYLGKNFDKLNESEIAIIYFLKTDSIYQLDKRIVPEIRNTYEHIIEYYKSKNDVDNQIKYYDRLIETDKIIDSTYTYVTETVEKKYETPRAIAERNSLLEEAKAKESTWKYSFGVISAILIAISSVLFFVYRRQKYYKQRFENIMTKSSGKEKSISTALDVTVEKEKTQPKGIGISEAIVNNILKGLVNFEVSEGFTKQVTLTDLAKDLETNPKYLSKVINWHHEKNFTSYINELRVNHAISKLKGDSIFRNYTIKAIATEVGFKGSESFSKSFYKVTGIYPSYFIKQLNKRIES